MMIEQADTHVDAAEGRIRVDICVIVPARSASATLQACLRHLRAASRFQPMTVRVVHDGGELRHLDEQEKSFSVSEYESPIVRNAGAARNFGAADLESGIIVFVDADVLVDERSLAVLIAPILDGDADATVGNYSDDVRSLSFAQAYKQLYIHTVYARRRGPIRNEFWTALGAVRADVFHGVGGFDTRFGGACGEDTEFGQRLTEAGYRIVATPDATARHLHPFSYAGLVRNDFTKGLKVMLNHLRHKNKMRDNRHTGGADIAAVALSGGVMLSAALVAIDPIALVATLVMFAGWVVARREFLQVFRIQGFPFFAKSIPVALSLDWVRGVCIPIAAVTFLMSKVARTS